MTLKRLICSGSLSLLIFSAVAAQQAPVTTGRVGVATEPSADESPEAQQALEKRALALLEEVVAETPSLRLAENRIRIQTIAANLLWTHDEERARALFREATNGLNMIMSGVEMSDPQQAEMAQQIATQLRHELLQMVAPRDPKLALEFLRATRQQQPASRNNPRYNPPDQELALEVNLANQIAAKDPQQALQMAEESLAKGVSPELIGLLNQLQAKDRAGAAKLTNNIIKKLRPELLTKDQGAAAVAANLLRMTRQRETVNASSELPVQGRGGEHLSLVGGMVIDEQARRELIDSVVAASTSAPAGRMEVGSTQMLLMALQEMMPEVEKHAPLRIDALRRKLAELNRTQDPQTRAWREYEGLMNNGTVEALLDAAPKAPPEMRDQLYSNAAWKALNKDGDGRARQIITEHIANPQQRAQMLKDMDRQILWRAAEQGKIEEARRLFATISPDERLMMIVQLASAAAQRGDEKVARQLLEEARDQTGGRAENYGQFSAQLQIARAYATLDPARSFEIIEAAIDRLNELITAAAVLNGFAQDSFKDGELRPQGGYMWNELIQNCAASLAVLAHTDFDRALSSVARFQRGDARLLARLWIAQGMLSDQAALEKDFRRGRPLRGRRGARAINIR